MDKGGQDVPQQRSARDDLDIAFRRIEKITAVGALIGALEQLDTADRLRDEQLFAWPVLRTRLTWFSGRLGGVLGEVLAHPTFLRIVEGRALAAAALLSAEPGRRGRALLLTGLFATNVANQLRLGGIGLDGSDDMATISFGVTALEKVAGSDRRSRAACMHFLALQSALSYTTAGLVKLASPTWRDGTAMAGVFRTVTYGDRRVYRLLRDRPGIARAAAWGVILSETAFPAVLLLPRRPARVAILGAGLFHLLSARYMGLNRFFWSFTAAHPALEYTRAAVRASWGPGPDRPGLPAGTGRVAAGLAGGAAALTTGAAALRWRTTRSARTGVEAPGRFVTVDGERVHVISRGGTDGPSVVFENAMACPSTEWSWVTEMLPPGIPWVAYDRPGLAWTPGLRGAGLTAELHARRLAALLRTLGLPPPYVLVGHSVGGLLVRSFAARHPDLVAGLVLVDASHPDQVERSAVQREEVPWVRQRLAVNHLRAVLGVLDDPFARSELHALPEPAADATLRQMLLPACWRASRRELRQWLGSWSAAARQVPSLSPRPVAVVTAGETVARDPVHTMLQRELAALSDVNRHDIVAQANHESLVMHRDHAGQVVEAIRWALAHTTAEAGRR